MELSRRRKSRLSAVALFLGLQCWTTCSFLTPSTSQRQAFTAPYNTIQRPQNRADGQTTAAATTSTARNVWWYGGSETVEPVEQDSCELVAVRIERTSANSRRIYGEITVPAPIRDVWAILTDYDRLSIHVPNLVESKIMQRTSGGEMGDGQYQCRLYQKGAQKIVGFEFGASVTMDMKEIIRAPFPPASDDQVGKDRKITFKCIDSFFFQEFDGAWHAKERTNDMGQLETLLSYVVDVRPKGPVPVAALEWRIREDVPTNLRAVKKAAMETGYDGVVALRGGRNRSVAALPDAGGALAPRVKIQWYKDETMAAYLKDH